jgi:hypothetical protein
MKYVFTVIVAAFLLACSKDSEQPKAQCYECTVGPFNGTPAYNTEICTDRIDTVVFKNAQGQSLGSVCNPK